MIQRILLIEDNPGDARLVKEHLQEAPGKYEVEIAESLKGGLRKLGETSYDAVLVDLSLPDAEGVESVREVLRHNGKSSVIVTTGLDNEDKALEAIQLGAQDYLVKDNISATSLVKALRYAGERSKIQGELKFQADLLASIGQAIIATDLEGRVIYWNDAAKEIYGWTVSEAIGENVVDLTPSDQSKAEANKILELMQAGNPWQGEFEVRHREGHSFPVLVTNTPVFDSRGNFKAIIGASVDISERKKLEESLKDSERQQAITVSELGERVKELTALHRTNVLLRRSEGNDDGQLLRSFVELIPPAFQYPDITAARVTLGDKQFSTKDYRATPWRLAKEFGIGGKERGLIEVVYFEDDRINEEAPFLLEEDGLLDTLADMLQAHFEKQLAEKAERERDEEVIILYQAASIATLATDLDQYLEEVTNTVEDYLSAQCFGIILYDRESGLLRPHPSYRGVSDADLAEVKIPLEGSVQGQALLTSETINLGESQGAESSVWTGKDIRSGLVIPIVYGESLIGVVDVQSDQPDHFTKHDKRLLEGLAEQMSSTINRINLQAEIIEGARLQESLGIIDSAIASSFDLTVTLSLVLDQVSKVLGSDSNAILLLDEARFDFTPVASRGLSSEELNSLYLSMDDRIIRRVVKDGPAVFAVEEAEIRSSQLESWLKLNQGYRGIAVAPLASRGEIVGLMLTIKREEFPNNDAFRNKLRLLAGQTAIAVENARMFENIHRRSVDLQVAYDATIEGWANALSLRDDETVEHSRRVVDNTLTLAKKIGLPPSSLTDIRRGALLHDIGKMGVPDSILHKPGPLTEEEFKKMQKHPVYAKQMLGQIEYLKNALEIPYYHHERWDGSGYPNGLAGKEIPLSARAFALVDVWDALTSDRPYRDAWTRERTREYVEANSGILFDPDLVEIFFELIDNGEIFIEQKNLQYSETWQTR